uniref:Secreted protein n=1 Tax=uncultured Thiotrichaceae bacterium TaxID=298394 RepID=A0A6S6SXK4_9GAMM|nr:MAG: Unknown protein [uncultured Thiotrichaceae bacterium]
MKTQFNLKSLLGVMAMLFAVTLPLTGCNDNDDPSVSEQLANQDVNSEPGALGDAAGIKAGIERSFGGPDSEPVDIDDGESIKDVFAKSGS